MIPIGDDNRDRRTTPVVTWGLIALNIFVFVFLQGFGSNLRFTYAYSTVPAEILSGKDVVTQDRVGMDPQTRQRYLIPGLQRTPVSVYLTILVSMFMHAGVAHILGNMLYLFIFGDNVEDRLGHGRFLLFYLFCGIAAALAQVFSTKLTGGNLYVPSLGASGAISGVLGAYLLLFPRRRVRVLVFTFFVAQMPAIFVVGFWFVFQIISGMGYLGGASRGGGAGGGVAYAAHIGGFLVGLFTVVFWTIGRRPVSRNVSASR
jgi:membrane associated rhomboid family serine protease